MWDRLLSGLGILPRSFRALFTAQLTMVYRSQIYGRATASPVDSVISPWFWVIGQNLIIGVIVGLALFARVDAFFFVLVGLSVSALVTAASMVVELNETVFDPDDQEILGHLPIPSRTYAAVRIANLLTFVAMTTLSVSLVPAIIGAGLRDATLGFTVYYLLAAFSLNALTASLVIGSLTLAMRLVSLSQVRELAGWMPTVLILLLFYGGQFLLRDKSQSVAYLAYDLPEFFAWYPVSWLAASFTSPPEFLPELPLGTLGIALLVALSVWGAVLWSLARFYSKQQMGGFGSRVATGRPLPKAGRLTHGLLTKLLRDPLAQAGYWLSGVMMQRDAQSRIRCWTSFSFAIAPLVLGWLGGQLLNPWQTSLTEGAASIAALHLIAFSVPGVLAALRFSKDHEASWILQVLPMPRPHSLFDGIALQLLIRFYVPVILLMVVLWSWVWQAPVHALLHGSIGLSSSFIAYYLCLALTAPWLPFSAASSTGQWTSASIALSLIAGLWTSFATSLHLASIQLKLPPFVLSLLLLIALFVARWFYRQRLRASPAPCIASPTAPSVMPPKPRRQATRQPRNDQTNGENDSQKVADRSPNEITGEITGEIARFPIDSKKRSHIVNVDLSWMRSVQAQVGLTLVLIVGTCVAACIPWYFRDRFESWSRLGFVSNREQVLKLIERWESDRVKLVASDEASLSRETTTTVLAVGSSPQAPSAATWTNDEMRTLFEGWLREDDARLESLFTTLLSEDQLELVQWCERGCVCGDWEQRQRSLRLLIMQPSEFTEPVLERLKRWALRRQLTPFFRYLNHKNPSDPPKALLTYSPTKN